MPEYIDTSAIRLKWQNANYCLHRKNASFFSSPLFFFWMEINGIACTSHSIVSVRHTPKLHVAVAKQQWNKEKKSRELHTCTETKRFRTLFSLCQKRKTSAHGQALIRYHRYDQVKGCTLNRSVHRMKMCSSCTFGRTSNISIWNSFVRKLFNFKGTNFQECGCHKSPQKSKKKISLFLHQKHDKHTGFHCSSEIFRSN